MTESTPDPLDVFSEGPNENDSFRSETDQLADAVSLMAFASEIDGGIHGFGADHDGDGWNEPLSDDYFCDCGEWQLHWVQVDRESTDRPDPTLVLITWAEHVKAAIQADG